VSAEVETTLVIVDEEGDRLTFDLVQTERGEPSYHVRINDARYVVVGPIEADVLYDFIGGN
jgi:hypothetical protein